MAKSFTIGRKGDQPFKIGAGGVSGEHARLTIDDAGRWYIEDLNSTNGTYLRGDDGAFVRIGRKEISEDSILRLGASSHQSYTFMAHRVLEPDGVYGYEFARLCKALREQEERENAVRMSISMHNRIAIITGVVVGVLFFLITSFIHFEPSIMNLVNGARLFVIPLSGGVVKLAFSKDGERMRQVVNRRRWALACPKCGRMLSDFDVQNMACPTCKAH